MTVLVGEPTPESEEKWAKRSDALARWLVSEWMRERENPDCVRDEHRLNSERRAGG
jgi:hypothetical protein